MRALKGQKGFIMIAAFLGITAISITSLALFSRAYVFQSSTESNVSRVMAFNLAEAGVDAAIVQLRDQHNYAVDNEEVLTGFEGGYGVLISPYDESGDWLPPGYRRVVSAGHSPAGVGSTQCASGGTGERGYACSQVVAYLEIDRNLFQYAAFAKEDKENGEPAMFLDGVPLVDSYDSNLGNYGGSNVNNEGDLASDGTMTFVGKPKHNGAVIENPNISCPPGTTPAGLTSLGPLVLTKEEKIYSGTYRYDSIHISGNGNLIVEGNVTLYVDGEITLGGNGVLNDDPKKLLIISTGGEKISVSGNADFYGGVYAPESFVEVTGNGDIYGSVIARHYKQSGTGGLHFDEALRGTPTPCTRIVLRSWQEKNVAAQPA